MPPGVAASSSAAWTEGGAWTPDQARRLVAALGGRLRAVEGEARSLRDAASIREDSREVWEERALAVSRAWDAVEADVEAMARRARASTGAAAGTTAGDGAEADGDADGDVDRASCPFTRRLLGGRPRSRGERPRSPTERLG